MPLSKVIPDPLRFSEGVQQPLNLAFALRGGTLLPKPSLCLQHPRRKRALGLTGCLLHAKKDLESAELSGGRRTNGKADVELDQDLALAKLNKMAKKNTRDEGLSRLSPSSSVVSPKPTARSPLSLVEPGFWPWPLFI